MEEHHFERPGGVTHGIAIRAFDPKTSQWAIWWIDSRAPHGALDPPVVGRFEKGVDICSEITPTSARWEQSYTTDAGATWDTNWITEFSRVQSS